ncbi:cutinase family protein [Arthrobacter sp. C152]
MDSFYKTIYAQLHAIGVDVSSHGIQYDAVPVGQDGPQGYGSTYYYSVQLGKNYLSSYVTDHLNKCPNEHLVLAGYSQGADVVHQVWNTLVAGAGLDRWRGRLDGLVLFADPRFSGYQVNSVSDYVPARSLNQGTFSWFISGLLAGGAAAALGNGDVIWTPAQEQFHFMKSYCDANDAVCQWKGNPWDQAAIDVHKGYVSRNVTVAAGNSINRWLIGHYFH